MSARDDEASPDAPGVWDADALVYLECLPQVGGGLDGAAVHEVALADPFQGARLFQGHADVAGDDKRLGVVLAGVAGVGGPGGELAKVVVRLGEAEPVSRGRGTSPGPADGWRRPPGSPRSAAAPGQDR